MKNELFLSIYASILSTIIFFWRMYEFYYEKNGNLKLKIEEKKQALVYSNYEISEFEIIFMVYIINRGLRSRVIDKPKIQLDQPIEGKKFLTIIDLESQITFPYQLEPGQKLEYPIPKDELRLKMKDTNVTKFKVVVSDTLDKSYCSKWIKLE